MNLDYGDVLENLVAKLITIEGLRPRDGVRVKPFGSWADLFFVPDADVGVSFVSDKPVDDPDAMWGRTERPVTATFCIAYKADVALNSAAGLVKTGGAFDLDATVRSNIGAHNIGTSASGPMALRTRGSNLLPHPERSATQGAVVLVRYFETTAFIA